MVDYDIVEAAIRGTQECTHNVGGDEQRLMNYDLRQAGFVREGEQLGISQWVKGGT